MDLWTTAAPFRRWRAFFSTLPASKGFCWWNRYSWQHRCCNRHQSAHSYLSHRRISKASLVSIRIHTSSSKGRHIRVFWCYILWNVASIDIILVIIIKWQHTHVYIYTPPTSSCSLSSVWCTHTLTNMHIAHLRCHEHCPSSCFGVLRLAYTHCFLLLRLTKMTTNATRGNA